MAGWLRAVSVSTAVGLAVAGCTSASSSPASQKAAGPHLDFVQRDGTHFTVAGNVWRFVGYNLPCANPFLMTSDQLGHYLDVVQQDSGANAIRMWFFQTNGGPGNWAPFDRVLAQVKAHGMRIVATLTNEWNGGCDAGAANTQKTLDWYQSGYKSPEVGHALSFRDYAAQVASRYANDPNIAMWQLVNEAQANTADASGSLRCDNAAGATALRAFSDDMAGVIKAVDHNHPVGLGTNGGSPCGVATSAAFQQVHDGALDMCEYHDYGASAAAMPGGPDFLAQRIHDCATLPHGGKPLFVGESGIQGNVQPNGGPPACTPWPSCSPFQVLPDTIDRRAALFAAKMKAALDAGVAGYLIWVKSPYYSTTDDIYAIGDGDPTENAMKSSGFATQ